MLKVIKERHQLPPVGADLKRILKLPSLSGPELRLGSPPSRTKVSLLHQSPPPPPSSLPLSLCCITSFLLNVFQSIKTLGSIRAERRGYDKVSFADYPPLPPPTTTHQHHQHHYQQQQKWSEREGESMYLLSSTKWGRKKLQPTKSFPPSLFLSSSLSPSLASSFPPFLSTFANHLYWLSSLLTLLCRANVCIGLWLSAVRTQTRARTPQLASTIIFLNAQAAVKGTVHPKIKSSQ